MADMQYYGTGRRKTSAARVFLSLGAGKIKINERSTKNVKIGFAGLTKNCGTLNDLRPGKHFPGLTISCGRKVAGRCP